MLSNKPGPSVLRTVKAASTIPFAIRSSVSDMELSFISRSLVSWCLGALVVSGTISGMRLRVVIHFQVLGVLVSWYLGGERICFRHTTNCSKAQAPVHDHSKT